MPSRFSFSSAWLAVASSWYVLASARRGFGQSEQAEACCETAPLEAMEVEAVQRVLLVHALAVLARGLGVGLRQRVDLGGVSPNALRP